jgi:hypothetical protein
VVSQSASPTPRRCSCTLPVECVLPFILPSCLSPSPQSVLPLSFVAGWLCLSLRCLAGPLPVPALLASLVLSRVFFHPAPCYPPCLSTGVSVVQLNPSLHVCYPVHSSASFIYPACATGVAYVRCPFPFQVFATMHELEREEFFIPFWERGSTIPLGR